MANEDGRVSWLSGAATALAILSCYGTAVLGGLLSMLGMSIAINERAWAGAISASAVLAVACIASSGLKRHAFGPTTVASLGLAFILWAMFGTYSRVIELAGFALLVGATLLDLRSSRSHRYVEGPTHHAS